MKTFWLIFCVFFQKFPFTESLMRYTVEERFEICSNGTGRYGDYSNFNLDMINDTLTIANGEMLVTKQINSPWKGGFYAEMFDRGQWSLKFQRIENDFCKVMLNPWEM